MSPRPATGKSSAVDVGDSEDGAFWTAFLRSLRARGLAGVQLVISDAHAGLIEAIDAVLIGAAWQRCRVHFMRNVLAKVPKASGEMVAAAIRTIFAQPDADTRRTRSSTRSPRMLAGSSPSSPTCSPTPVPTSSRSPRSRRRTGGRSGPPTRSNGSTRRSNGVPTSSGIFPNDAAVMRLVTAVIAETHDEWAVSDRRYLSEGSMNTALRQPNDPPACPRRPRPPRSHPDNPTNRAEHHARPTSSYTTPRGVIETAALGMAQASVRPDERATLQ